MTLLLLYVALALGVSFICSIMEAVLLSVTPSFVAHMERDRGGVVGRKLRAYKDHVDRPLAAILSLNTIAHTLGAAGAGAQAATVFGNAYVGIISGVLTSHSCNFRNHSQDIGGRLLEAAHAGSCRDARSDDPDHVATGENGRWPDEADRTRQGGGFFPSGGVYCPR